MNPQIPTIKSEIVTNFVEKLGTPGSIPTEVVIETLNDIVDAIPDVEGLIPIDGDETINDRKTFTESLTIPDGIQLQDSASINNIIQLPKDIRFQKLQRTIPDILVLTSAPNKCKDFLRLVPANNYCFVKIYAVNQDSTVKTFEFSAGYDALDENTWSTLVPLTVYNDRGEDFNIEIKKVTAFGPTNFGIIFRYRNTTGTNKPSQASMKVEFGLRLPAVGVNYDQFNVLTTPEYDFSGGTSLYGQKLTRTPDGLNWVDVANKKFLKEGDVVPQDISGKAEKDYVDTQDEILDAKFVNYLPTTEKGAANGLTPLGADNKVPAQYLPAGAQVYKGTWNPATNTPALADGVGTAGWTYRVTVSGDRNLGSGIISFLAGDDVIYNGTVWERNPDSLSVASVAGKTGDVTLVKGDVGLGNVDNTSDVNKPVSTPQATAIGQREPTIAAGTTAQYYRGDKTWQSFATGTLAVILTTLGAGSNTPITTAMSLVNALANLQAQVSAAITALTTKANLVGGVLADAEIPNIPSSKLPLVDIMPNFNPKFFRDEGSAIVGINPFEIFARDFIEGGSHGWAPQLGVTTIGGIAVPSANLSGTGTARSYDPTSFLGSERRIGLVGGVATAGTRISQRDPTPRFTTKWGFRGRVRYCASQAAPIPDLRIFAGFTPDTGNMANAEPSNMVNIVCVGKDGADTNLNVMYNDGTGVATKLDLGINYPANTSSADIYDISIYVLPNAESAAVRIIRISGADGSIVASDVKILSGNLPDLNTLLCSQLWMSNNTTVVIPSMEIMASYYNNKYIQ